MFMEPDEPIHLTPGFDPSPDPMHPLESPSPRVAKPTRRQAAGCPTACVQGSASFECQSWGWWSVRDHTSASASTVRGVAGIDMTRCPMGDVPIEGCLGEVWDLWSLGDLEEWEGRHDGEVCARTCEERIMQKSETGMGFTGALICGRNSWTQGFRIFGWYPPREKRAIVTAIDPLWRGENVGQKIVSVGERDEAQNEVTRPQQETRAGREQGRMSTRETFSATRDDSHRWINSRFEWMDGGEFRGSG
ncbi:hypothetical protein M427DRAFT_143856 [Gonapodya prolifera JEL478]|uniref:Uncharacterized protein n=1 Tax=Gonapodya prolifera (strain JEL478) TaxID=1344416 RepID=A0A139APL6_GONPJ|nr:hypothetical protein M427DRAFT_143856 [Gonapodya prolifera JEL478]|eukprot:KXS18435.1 hypothetical protein M427DRAFT_143856 [Gonapodya prolifera JEL478]